MLAELLPSGVKSVETFGDIPDCPLFAEEEAVIGRAVAARRREFATVRWCARAALARLGYPPVPVLPGERGAPTWPAGVVGSITHCPGYRAAAVALAGRSGLVALGVDAEPSTRLPAGVLETVALGDELASVAALRRADPSVPWDRVLFCAKESVYKAWYPLTRRWLDFHDVSVRIDVSMRTVSAGSGGRAGERRHGRFRARVPAGYQARPGTRHGPISFLSGRWLMDRGLVVTAVAVPER